MMDARFEVLDAFVDGERVDPAALKQALADAEGRDYLVDAWLLREGVQEEMASDASVLAVPPPRARSGRSWLFAAAAAAILCLVGGYVIGYRTAGPTASRQDAGTRAAPVAAGASAAPSFPVPTATRVIQLEFGADPTTGRGGD